jgi:multiphosphoryl transfer protein
MERALEGVSAAPGIAIGPAMVLDRPAGGDTRHVALSARPAELQRAHDALQGAAADLLAIASRLREAGRDDEADIVETGMLMATDPVLMARVEAFVRDTGLSAPHALRAATDEVASQLAGLSDPVLALRADDVRSLGRRASARAAGIIERAGEAVLIASTLGPADVAEFAALARGIALAAGGVTSHAAIVARSLGLPMVVGLGDEVLDTSDGEDVVIDGDHGILFATPAAARIATARADGERRRAARDQAIARRAEPAQTTDGRRIRVLANASTAAELEEALQQGAEGIGLLRTELLFLEASGWPTLEQQVNVLRPVLARVPGQTATVRLFDFGGDKTPPFLRGIKTRGIEVLLDAPGRLREHLAAVAEAGRGTSLRILVPMVTAAEQMRVVRHAVGRSAQTGAMIETPEAAAGAAAIAQESDFLSIGTNDLTQLALGLAREQSRRAPVLDARVLTLIAQAMRAARAAGIPVDVCGEAASDPNALPVMVGLGADELSVAPARVGQVRQWIRELAFAAAEKEAEALLHETGHARRERV